MADAARRRRLLVLGLAVAGALVSTPVMAHDPPSTPALYKVVAPVTAPLFELLAPDERVVRLLDLRGRVVLLTFFYTNCPDTCPLFVAKLRVLEQKLDGLFGKKVAFVLITVDPERDDGPALRRYREAMGATHEGWWFLTGELSAIEGVARGYGVFSARKAAGGTVDHASVVYLVDTRGYVRVKYVGRALDVDLMARHIGAVLQEGSRGVP